MYRYAPDGLPAGSPVVVVLHGCTQDAATYFEGAGWKSFADSAGFSVVAAQQEQGNNINKCFNWFQSGDVARGQGEAASIKQMVDRTVADLDGDASRVFVTGLSAGGAMTSSMLAAYPDVFKAGAVIAGLPHGCATTVAEAFTCMNPGVTKSASEWGDLARSAAPDHSGARPTVSVWHGTADTTVVPASAKESVKQWTDVHGADQEADATEELPGGTTRDDYTGEGGSVVVRELHREGHGSRHACEAGRGMRKGRQALPRHHLLQPPHHEGLGSGRLTGGPVPSPALPRRGLVRALAVRVRPVTPLGERAYANSAAPRPPLSGARAGCRGVSTELSSQALCAPDFHDGTGAPR